MAKRFISTEIWDEDWFLEMTNEYKLFWFYILSSCDHAGIFKVNLRSFCSLNEVKLTSTQALIYFNNGKERIMVISDSIWLISDFFVFQYGTTFNPNNRVHESIENIYKKYKIDINLIRGLIDLKDRAKDKDKDKDVLLNSKKSKDGKFSGNFKAQGEELFAQRFSTHGTVNKTRIKDL